MVKSADFFRNPAADHSVSVDRRPTILFVDDDPLISEGFKMAFQQQYQLILCSSADEGLKKFNSHVTVAILDIRMQDQNGFELCDQIKAKDPDLPVIFFSGYPGDKNPFAIINEHKPFAFIVKSDNLDELKNAIDQAIKYRTAINESKLYRTLMDKITHDFPTLSTSLQRSIQADAPLNEFLKHYEQERALNIHLTDSRSHYFVPDDSEYLNIIETVKKAALAKLNILIQGDSGTGKTALGFHIAAFSPGVPFVSIDSQTSLKDNLALADGGFLFVDDIEQLSVSDQNLLSETLRTKKWKAGEADFILIAASSSNLSEHVKKNKFSRDLYQYIKMVVIELPTLKEVPHSIMQFVQYFARRYSKPGQVMEFDKIAVQYFEKKKWEENIRSIKNEIQKTAQTGTSGVDLKELDADTKKKMISKALKQFNYRIKDTADYLHIKRTTLYQTIESLGIDIVKRPYASKNRTE